MKRIKDSIFDSDADAECRITITLSRWIVEEARRKAEKENVPGHTILERACILGLNCSPQMETQRKSARKEKTFSSQVKKSFAGMRTLKRGF